MVCMFIFIDGASSSMSSAGPGFASTKSFRSTRSRRHRSRGRGWLIRFGQEDGSFSHDAAPAPPRTKCVTLASPSALVIPRLETTREAKRVGWARARASMHDECFVKLCEDSSHARGGDRCTKTEWPRVRARALLNGTIRPHTSRPRRFNRQSSRRPRSSAFLTSLRGAELSVIQSPHGCDLRPLLRGRTESGGVPLQSG